MRKGRRMELKTLFFFEFSVAESEHFFWKLMGVTCHCFLLLIFSRRSKGRPVFDWLFLRCFQLEKGLKKKHLHLQMHILGVVSLFQHLLPGRGGAVDVHFPAKLHGWNTLYCCMSNRNVSAITPSTPNQAANIL